jgi:hypothetical protein
MEPTRPRLGGRKSVLPDGEELDRLNGQTGLSFDQIGAMYGVSGQAAQQKHKRWKQGTDGSTNWSRHWPGEWWKQRHGGNKVRTDHAGTYIYKQLLNYTKRRYGVEIRPHEVQILDDFLDHLRKNNLVVYYLYEDANGFRLRSRRDGDGPDVIWAAEA